MALLGGFTLGFGDSGSGQEVALAGVRVMLWVSAGVGGRGGVGVRKSPGVIEMLTGGSAPRAGLARGHISPTPERELRLSPGSRSCFKR